jgi:hypothetical protein
MRYHDEDTHYHTESKRRARRFRRWSRRPRLIPMEGLIPRRIQSLERWKVKLALKRRHRREITRGWNGREKSRYGATR